MLETNIHHHETVYSVYEPCGQVKGQGHTSRSNVKNLPKTALLVTITISFVDFNSAQKY